MHVLHLHRDSIFPVRVAFPECGNTACGCRNLQRGCAGGALPIR